MNIQLKSDLFKLESIIRKRPQEMPSLKNYFCEGMYAREIYAKAGNALVGATHKKENFYSLLEGECIIIQDGKRERIKAPFVGVTRKGTKRAIYALTDYRLITYHRVDGETMEEIQRECIEEDMK